MKGKHSFNRIREQVVIESWRRLNAESLGAVELEAILRELADGFGESVTLSPALIARVLAEDGARLRHSEILNFHTQWCKRRLTELFSPGELDFSSLPVAFDSMQKIEELREQFERDDDRVGLNRLRELILGLKEDFQSTAKAKVDVGKARSVAEEVAQWLTVWLQNPQIFLDWLELRRNTAEFLEKLRE